MVMIDVDLRFFYDGFIVLSSLLVSAVSFHQNDWWRGLKFLDSIPNRTWPLI